MSKVSTFMEIYEKPLLVRNSITKKGIVRRWEPNYRVDRYIVVVVKDDTAVRHLHVPH